MLGSEGVTVLVHTVCSRKNVPRFHTVFARVYHCAISELCKGLYYRNGV